MMRKLIALFMILFLSLTTFGLTGCEGCTREESTEEKIEDGLDEVGDAVEEGAEEVEDAVDDN